MTPYREGRAPARVAPRASFWRRVGGWWRGTYRQMEVRAFYFDGVRPFRFHDIHRGERRMLRGMACQIVKERRGDWLYKLAMGAWIVVQATDLAVHWRDRR